jgi:5-oxoprolinase (ATP-hydrolysing) subunit A
VRSVRLSLLAQEPLQVAGVVLAGEDDEGRIVFVRRVGDELDPEEVGDRVVRGITEGTVTSVNGNEIEVPSESICIHSDTPGAVELAEAIARKLE